MTIESTTDTAEQIAQATAGEATTDSANGADDAEETGGEDGEEQHKRKGGFQRRIDKLTARNKELEAKLAGGTESSGKAGSVEQSGPATKPQLDKFDSYEDFIEALTAWKLDDRETSKAASAQKAEAEKVQADLASAWDARLEAARAKHEDFDELMDADIQITSAMQQVLFESDFGAELAYWLGSNPDEAKRIAGLSPVAAVKALTKIEDSLPGSTALAQPKRRATWAPDPISPVGGRYGAVGKDPEKMTHQEFIAWRQKGGGR